MREILFRGKTYNDKWVQGLLVQMDDHLTQIRKLGSDGIGYYDYSIVPSTVGQYTGLTDKNGKKIFEGDIIKGNFSNYVIWADETERAFVYGKSYKGGYKNLMSDYLLKSSFPNGMEVIGNIHDNPELLEVVE